MRKTWKFSRENYINIYHCTKARDNGRNEGNNALMGEKMRRKCVADASCTSIKKREWLLERSDGSKNERLIRW